MGPSLTHPPVSEIMISPPPCMLRCRRGSSLTPRLFGPLSNRWIGPSIGGRSRRPRPSTFKQGTRRFYFLRTPGDYSDLPATLYSFSSPLLLRRPSLSPPPPPSCVSSSVHSVQEIWLSHPRFQNGLWVGLFPVMKTEILCRFSQTGPNFSRPAFLSSQSFFECMMTEVCPSRVPLAIFHRLPEPAEVDCASLFSLCDGFLIPHISPNLKNRRLLPPPPLSAPPPKTPPHTKKTNTTTRHPNLRNEIFRTF